MTDKPVGTPRNEHPMKHLMHKSCPKCGSEDLLVVDYTSSYHPGGDWSYYSYELCCNSCGETIKDEELIGDR